MSVFLQYRVVLCRDVSIVLSNFGGRRLDRIWISWTYLAVLMISTSVSREQEITISTSGRRK